MFDAIAVMLVVVLVLGLTVIALVLPIVTLVKVVRLRERVRELATEVRYLREREPAALPVVEAVEEEPVELAAAGVAEPVVERPRVARRRYDPERSRGQSVDWSKLEAWLGVRGLGWAAVVLLIFTGGFFLKLVFEKGEIGDLGKVGIGVAIGTILCLAGWYCHRRSQVIFSQMLTSAGVGLLYLSIYASFDFYKLLPKEGGTLFLILLVAEAFALAVLYDAPAIAIIAVGGGLLTPILLRSDVDQYRSLFTYLAVLNAGVVMLSLVRRWWVVSTLALVGTQLLFWGWFGGNYHPAKLEACLVFQLGIFALYVVQTVLVHVWFGKPANIEELIRVPVLAALTALVGYVLLDPDYHRWLGSAAVGMAIVYAALAGLVNRRVAAGGQPGRRSAHEPLLFAMLALSMAFVATVFPLQATTTTAWIALGWAVQGLALWWFGLRVRTVALYGMGAVFLALSAVRLLFVDTIGLGKFEPHTDIFIPIFNGYGLPATLVSVCLLAAALLQRRTMPAPDSSDFLLMRCLGVAGVVLLWIVCSIETYDFFVVRGNLYAPGVQARLTQAEKEMPRIQLENIYADREEHLRLTARMSLSAVWAAYALALLAVGLRLQNRPVRWLGLGLFALTLGKVMLVDTDQLRGEYRVGAFFALSLMMAAGAWAYQKLRRVLAVQVPPVSEIICSPKG